METIIEYDESGVMIIVRKRQDRTDSLMLKYTRISARI